VTRALAAMGVELTRGDLKDADSVATACKGVETVVCTASAISSQTAGDSIQSVDAAGNAGLVNLAQAANVAHFVFVSFASIPIDFALKRAKAEVEAKLEHAGQMTHTVLKPVYFQESWLPFIAPAANSGPAVFFGNGESPVSWIARDDVARYIVAAVQNPILRNQTVELGGPDALCQREVFELFQSLGAPKAELLRVSEQILRDEYEKAPNSLTEAFGALKLGIALGLRVQPALREELRLPRLTTVREFAVRLLESR